MSMININNGDTGLAARTAINANFTELDGKVYLSPVDGDNTSNLNTAIAALPAGGGIIYLKGGAEYNISGDGLNIVDGLIIEGDGAIIGRHDSLNADKYVFDIDSDIEITLKNLTVKHDRILRQTDGTLNIENVEFSYHTTEGDAIVNTTGGNIYAKNFSLDSLGTGASNTCSYFGSDNMIVRGGKWTVRYVKFIGTGNFKINLDVLEKDDTSEYYALLFGEANTYDFLTHHADWVAHNAAQTLTVSLHVNIASYVYIKTHGSVEVEMYNTSIDYSSFAAYDNSVLKCFNCQGAIVGPYYKSNARIELNKCYFRKDMGKDLVPYPEDVYNEDNWGTNGAYVDHITEVADVPLNDYSYYPLIIMRDSTFEYMGDDVLNSLGDTQLLAELEANPTYTEDSTALPGNPAVGGTWAAATNYTDGDIIYSPETWRGGDSKKYAMLVMEDHTSSADWQDDMYDGKIRALFGANRQTNGKYQQLIYLETTGWYATIQPTLAYHGGGKRNRGCGMYFYSNFIIENCKFIDHAGVYSTRINCSQALSSRSVGTLAYRGISVVPVTFGYIDNLTLEFKGMFNGQMKTGIEITMPRGYDGGEFIYNNIKSVGKGMHCVLFLTNMDTAYENIYNIGILSKQHDDVVNAVYWPERYNSENFIVGSFNSTPAGYSFNDWVNYLFDFKNEQRDRNEYPI